jgi:hypothetical protein
VRHPAASNDNAKTGKGLSKVQQEWKIVCAALNLRRMNVLRMA